MPDSGVSASVEQANRAGKRLLYTSMTHGSARFRTVDAAPDLEVSVGGDRALCRLTDLLELALFTSARLTSKRRTADPAFCKDNSAT